MVLQLKLRSAEGSQRIILSRCGAAGENIWKIQAWPYHWIHPWRCAELICIRSGSPKWCLHCEQAVSGWSPQLPDSSRLVLGL